MLSKGKTQTLTARRERDYAGLKKRSAQPTLGESGALWSAFNQRAVESRRRHQRTSKRNLPGRAIRRLQHLFTGFFS